MIRLSLEYIDPALCRLGVIPSGVVEVEVDLDEVFAGRDIALCGLVSGPDGIRGAWGDPGVSPQVLSTCCSCFLAHDIITW